MADVMVDCEGARWGAIAIGFVFGWLLAGFLAWPFIGNNTTQNKEG